MSDGPYQGHDEARRSAERSAVLVETLALYLLQYAGPEYADTAQPKVEELRSIRDNVLSLHNLTFDEHMQQQAERLVEPLHSTNEDEEVSEALSEQGDAEWLRHSGAWSSFAYELFKENLIRRERLMEIFLEAHFGDRILGFGRCEGENGEKLRMTSMDERIGNHLLQGFSSMNKDTINPQTGRPYNFFLVLTDMAAYRFDEMRWED